MRSDPAVVEALAGATGTAPVTAVSTDLFYDTREDVLKAWTAGGAAVVEMEAAAVLQVAARRGVRAGCLLAVTDQLGNGRVRAEFEAVEEMGIALGETAWSALERAGV